MHILWTIVIGFVIGLLARLFMPGKDSEGFILTTVLGIVGAFVGTFLGQALGFYQNEEAAGLIMSVIGAMLVLFVFKKLTRRSSLT